MLSQINLPLEIYMDRDKVKQLLRFRWIIFFILALAYLLVYFHRLSFSVVAGDLKSDFKTTASVLGLLGSIYFYCYAFMQFPAGLCADSVGPRKTVTFSLLIASAGSILFGLAPNIQIAFFSRILVGLGVSMVFIPTMKILSQWFRAKEFALMAGILNAVGGLGVFAGTWILALMTDSLGWRLSFQIIGFCTLGVILSAWVFVRDKPSDKGWPLISEIEDQSNTNAENAADDNEKISLWAGAKQVVSNKYFWPVAIWFFFDCGIFFGFGSLWSGPFLMNVYKLSKVQAGSILSMIAWAMIITSPILGLISDRILKSRKKTIIATSSILVVLFILLYIFPSQFPTPLLYVWFFFFSVCSSAIVAIGFTTTKELFPVRIAGTSVGTVNLFPFLGGAVFMPILGKVLDAHAKTNSGIYTVSAFRSVILILLVSAIIAWVCSFLMKETFPD
jgi:sugar phosphate permease